MCVPPCLPLYLLVYSNKQPSERKNCYTNGTVGIWKGNSKSFIFFSLLFKCVGADTFMQATECKIHACVCISEIIQLVCLTGNTSAASITEFKFLLRHEACCCSVVHEDKLDK